MIKLVSDHARITAISQLIHLSGALLLSRTNIPRVDGPASNGTASGTSRGSPSGKCPMIPPVGGGKIIFKAIRKSTIPPPILNDCCCRLSKFKRYHPRNRKINNTRRAKSNSQMRIFLRRFSSGICFRIERNIGIFPNGSMIRISVNVAESRSILIIVSPGLSR